MRPITLFFILNATLLILHEIESSYEKEWEILRLPVKISGFLILHIPIILLLFYGVVEIKKLTPIGLILGIVIGIGGMIPFLVHKVIVNRKDKFNMKISNIIIYTNLISGIITIVLSINSLVSIK
ncbi:MAG: hypothetical protein GX285_00055 [Clostridiales bacterium]|nr:hypothetical protein [Clostridiales bacterium]